VVSYAKENMYVVKTLKEFQHIDDNGKDVGANVRQKAKDITNLLSDDVRLRDERQQRSQTGWS
jgi:epsin